MTTLDSINSMSPQEAVRTAYFTATQLQDFPKAQQIAGVALFLNELCEQLGLDPRVMLNKAARMAADADSFYTTEVRALRAYINGEF